MTKLTARGVPALTEPGRYGDGKGLYLQVSGTGTRSWLFIYQALAPTDVGGVVRVRSKTMGLGPVGNVTLAEARELVDQYRKLRRQGIDPIEHRDKGNEPPALVPTFEAFAEEWIAENESRWKAGSKGAPQWRSSLAAYAFPHIGDVALDKITTAHMKAVLAPIWTAKNETARKVRMRVRQILDAAKALGHRTGDNPADWRGNLKHVLPHRAKVHVHHAALPYNEVPAFVAKLRKRDAVASKAFEFAILTAGRTGEVLGARWSEIKLKEKLWEIPGERMKNGKPHRVPLSDRALRILRGLPHEHGSPFVFVGERERKPLSNMAMLALLKRMEVETTVHGFRSSFRDWAAETTSTPNHVVEMALAHSIGDEVEAAYRRGDLFQKRRQLMQKWAEFCGRK